jgi:hypothetical protein
MLFIMRSKSPFPQSGFVDFRSNLRTDPDPMETPLPYIQGWKKLVFLNPAQWVFLGFLGFFWVFWFFFGFFGFRFFFYPEERVFRVFQFQEYF